MSAWDLVLIALAGAFFALDQDAWPSLVPVPALAAGALAGALAGHLEAGIAAGAVAQLLAVAVLPVGGAALPEAWLAGLAAALTVPGEVALSGAAWLDDGRLAIPAIVAVGAGTLGRTLLLAQRRLQFRWSANLSSRLDAGHWDAPQALHARALIVHALRGALSALAAAALAPVLGALLAHARVEAPAGRIALALGAVALVGVAARRHRRRALLAGAIAGMALAWIGGVL